MSNALENKILGLLHERIGFNPESVGEDKLLASLRACLKKRKISDPDEFFESLRRGHAEFNRIVEEIIVPETWFFRDGEPFELLKRHAIQAWPRLAQCSMRCLSLPCSTGEEPYSIAMALLDAGLSVNQFTVDGIDISDKNVQRARQAQYGSYSFRSKETSYRERHFEALGNGQFKLHERVRGTVQFAQGNLLDLNFMNDGRKYDIIFCRNLLIYFDQAGWAQALKTLTRLLADTGLLFMGHAEALEFTAPQFESVRWPCAFAYRKKAEPPAKPGGDKFKAAQVPGGTETKTKATQARKRTESTVLKRVTFPLLAPPPASSSNSSAPVSVPTAGPGNSADVLKEAGRLADQGKFAEANQLCQKYLNANPCSAEAYFLLGLIAEASGQPQEAEGKYLRALYLDRKHQEALVHLALMLEARGDLAGAVALRRRLERAESGK